MSSLKESFSTFSDNSSKKMNQCENCELIVSELWCGTCNLCLCSQCFEIIHNNKALRQHARIPIDQRPPPLKICPRHTRKVLEYWCANDETILCQDCFMTEHINHTIKTIDDAARQKFNEIKSRIDTMQTPLNDYQEKLEVYRPAGHVARSIITEKFTHFRQLLDDIEEKLMDRIASIEDKNKSLFDEYTAHLQNIMDNLNSVSENLISIRNSMTIIEQYKIFNEKLDDIQVGLSKMKNFNGTKPRFYNANDIQDKFEKVMKMMHITEEYQNPTIPLDTKWSSAAMTVVTGLGWPHGIAIDCDTGIMFVADYSNKRVISWDINRNKMNVIATNLVGPTSVLVDKKTNSIIIADREGRKVSRWSLETGINQSETIVSNVHCDGIVMDREGAIYVTDDTKHEVRKFSKKNETGILVAGGNGAGRALNQFNGPRQVDVDCEGAIYVADWNNHRVMKWMKGAKEGTVVAGGNGAGPNLNQLHHPIGVRVDRDGHIYVIDCYNHRVTRWRRGQLVGEMVVDAKAGPNIVNKLKHPHGFAFDKQNNLFLSDFDNNRVQLFKTV